MLYVYHLSVVYHGILHVVSTNSSMWQRLPLRGRAKYFSSGSVIVPKSGFAFSNSTTLSFLFVFKIGFTKSLMRAIISNVHNQTIHNNLCGKQVLNCCMIAPHNLSSCINTEWCGLCCLCRQALCM